MKQTIDAGDTVLVNTLAYSHGKPRRGEVIEFKAPPDWSADPGDVRYLKRVVATGGDHVTCCDAQHRLTVNGRALDEPYLFRDADVSEAASPDAFDVVVPDGRLWLMGDARYHSSDSREKYLIGHDLDSATIEVKFVTGRVFAVLDSHNHDEARQLTVPPTYAGIPAPKR
jgi:signal peptidase I